jgi:Na+-translocating ferredoxin:NAD+ oxidoreductase RnfA subunit
MSLFSAALGENLALTQLLGLGPLLIGSQNRLTARELALMLPVVFTATVAAGLLLELLLQQAGLIYWHLLGDALLLGLTAELSRRWMRAHQAALAIGLGPLLPLLTANTGLLALLWRSQEGLKDPIDCILNGLGASIGLSGVLIVLAALRDRLRFADVPQPFQGLSIILISLSLMALAFMGLARLGG